MSLSMKREGSKMKSHKDGGFTILEVLIALAILAIGILAVATMQATAIKGNSQAIGITEGITLAQDKVEELMKFPYDTSAVAGDPLGDTNGDGTNQDGDSPPNGIDDDDEGTVVDGILNFGFGQTGGAADHTENVGRYTIHWNVAVNQPITNVKTVRIIVLWSDRGAAKRASVEFMKMDVI